jgi:hypothetical protein
MTMDIATMATIHASIIKVVFYISNDCCFCNKSECESNVT